jgi:hypothetical protein
MPRTAEPLSPELILVSPPEEAALAREQLPDLSEPSARHEEPTPTNGASAAGWDEFLADVRNRPVEPVAPPRVRPPVPVRRNSRKRLVVGAAALLAVAIVVGLAWARDRTQQKPAAASEPAAPNGQATAPNPATPKATKSQARAPFVPTRVWSWAEVPGARAYVVRFLRNGQKVLKIRAGSPRLALPARFSFAPGDYRWTVTTVPRNGGRGRVIVNSSFKVTAPNG